VIYFFVSYIQDWREYYLNFDVNSDLGSEYELCPAHDNAGDMLPST